ncbi:MAG: DUF2378 family protein [Myxococcales bacterium]|nr:DUF2378 family protein [Myxococcales bacterium]
MNNPEPPLVALKPQPIDAADLRIRLSMATPADTAKGMFFNGVLSAVERLVGPEARERCRKAGGEKKYIDFFNYPIAEFLPIAFTAASLLSEKLGGYEAAFRRLGQQAVEDFLSSTVGKTLLLLAGSDPRRLLSAAAGAYRTAVSYGERSTEFLSEKRCYFKVKRDFMPHPYHEGVFLAVIESLGAKQVKVVGRRIGPLDAYYDISWE